MMRVLRVIELSGPDGVRLETVSRPPGEGDVLLDVRAIGLGYSTLLRSIGKYQERSDPPYILDGEVAGIVVSAPEGSSLRAGDRIAAPSATGFAAERVVVPSTSVLRLPDHVSFEQGAGLRNFETALFALESRGRLRAGES